MIDGWRKSKDVVFHNRRRYWEIRSGHSVVPTFVIAVYYGIDLMSLLLPVGPLHCRLSRMESHRYTERLVTGEKQSILLMRY